MSSKIFYRPTNTDYTDTHTYYNASMVNNTNLPIVANYNDSRDEELLLDPEHWHISVERTDIDALYIPLFHFEDNSLSIALSYNAPPNVFTQKVNVIYVSEFEVANPATDTNQPVYSINHFLKMINTAFSTAYAALIPLLPVPPEVLPPKLYPTRAPAFIYDANTKLFSLVVEKTYDPLYAPAGVPISISVNTRLYNMLGGCWDTIYKGTSNVLDYDYKFNIYTQFTNNITVVSPLGALLPGYEMKGEYVSSNLKDAVKLILTTTMPVQREYIPSLSGTTTTGANSTLSILTDFSIGSQTDDIGRPGYLYIPQYPRNIDLVGNIPLRNITLQVQWQDRAGKIYPVYIPPHSAFNIKIAFKRKRSYDK